MTDHPDGSADDHALLRAHVAGDPEAFGVLFARHRDRLWAVALRTTSDPEEAADALQDAMVAAFRRAESFRGDSAVTTWLHRIVVNACLDRLRRRKVRRAEPLPDDSDERDRLLGAGSDASVLPDEGTDPAVAALGEERRRAVLAALERLPLEQRAALVLVDMEGYSVEETAAILDCAAGTVKSRCARGRARLLPLLEGHAPTHAGADGRPGAGSGTRTGAVRGEARNPRAAPDVQPAHGPPPDRGGDRSTQQPAVDVSDEEVTSHDA